MKEKIKEGIRLLNEVLLVTTNKDVIETLVDIRNTLETLLEEENDKE